MHRSKQHLYSITTSARASKIRRPHPVGLTSTLQLGAAIKSP
jgi:hypothetical protein